MAIWSLFLDMDIGRDDGLRDNRPSGNFHLRSALNVPLAKLRRLRRDRSATIWQCFLGRRTLDSCSASSGGVIRRRVKVRQENIDHGFCTLICAFETIDLTLVAFLSVCFDV